jgi:hypothetical protein
MDGSAWTCRQQVRTGPHGLDYIVDFPATEGGGPADRTPPWATARVQVKGMGRGVERKSVKLSNWAHAVKNAEPFFFVVIRFDFPEDDVPEVADVFVVHVDRDWCGRVLKRLREQTNESEPLHKQTVDLTWREDEGIVAPFAENLDIRMREMIGEPHEYTRRKLNWFGTVGYEPDRFHLSFTPDAVDVDTACRRLADFAIGLEKQLPLRSAAISDVRFGKAIPVQEFEGAAPQYLEMTAQRPHGRATVDIDLLDGTDSVTLNCDGYASHLVFPELPKEYLKIRCIAGPVELIFDARNGTDFLHPGQPREHPAFTTPSTEVDPK